MSKTNYDIIKTIASLAEKGDIEEMGVYKREGKGWEVSIYTGDRYNNGRKKYYRELVKTKKEALQREKELLEEYQQKTQQIIQDELNRLLGVQQPVSASFEKAAKEWLNIKKLEVRKTTFESYRINTEVHLIPFFGEVNVAEITETDVRIYLAEKSAKLSSTTLRHHYSALSMILKHNKNYCMSAIKRPQVNNFEPEIIRDLNELKEFVKGFKDVTSYLATRIAAATGMRLSEVAGLRWRDIDFKNNIIRVRRSLHYDRDDNNKLYYYIESTKNKTSARSISVGEGLIKELGKIKKERGNQKDNDYVCIDQFDRPVNRQNIYDSFKKRAIKLGYPNIRFHDLRHSHATIAIQQLKMSARTVQLRLGHSSVTTTLGIYTAEFAAQDKEIGEAFDF